MTPISTIAAPGRKRALRQEEPLAHGQTEKKRHRPPVPFSMFTPAAEIDVSLREIFGRLPEETWFCSATKAAKDFAPLMPAPATPSRLLGAPDSVIILIASFLDPHEIDDVFLSSCKRLWSVVVSNPRGVRLAKLESTLGYFSVFQMYADRVHDMVEGGWGAVVQFLTEVSRRMQYDAYGRDISVSPLHRALVGEQVMGRLVGVDGGILCFRGLENDAYGHCSKVGSGFKECFKSSKSVLEGKTRLKKKKRNRPSFEFCFAPNGYWPRILLGDVETSFDIPEDCAHMNSWLSSAREEISRKEEESTGADDDVLNGFSPNEKDRIRKNLLPVVWFLDIGDESGDHNLQLAVGRPPRGKWAVCPPHPDSDADAGVWLYAWAGECSSPRAANTITPWCEANHDGFPWGSSDRHWIDKRYRWPSLAAMFCLSCDLNYARLHYGNKDWQMNALAWLVAHRIEPFDNQLASSRFLEQVLAIEQQRTEDNIARGTDSSADIVFAWTVNFARAVVSNEVGLAKALDCVNK